MYYVGKSHKAVFVGTLRLVSKSGALVSFRLTVHSRDARSGSFANFEGSAGLLSS